MTGESNERDDFEHVNGRPALQQARVGEFDNADELSTSVVRAVAEVATVDASELGTSLYESIDPDALDNLFENKFDGTPRTGIGHVTFTMVGYEATVHSDGRIVVREQSDAMQ